MFKQQRVEEMVVEILTRQAKARSGRTGETLEEAYEAVTRTDAGRLLKELKAGSHSDEEAKRWQENLTLERTAERTAERNRVQREEQEAERAQRAREREKERDLAQQASWESFMRVERQEIALRKDGQLAEKLGEALPGESQEALRRLVLEDQRQAAEGLVALMKNGTLSYKRLEELCAGDMPARSAANRLRMTWLKERHDGWLARGRRN